MSSFMKKTLAALSLTLMTSSSFASNLTVTQSILANDQIMAQVAAMAYKQAKADEFLGIEVVSNNRAYQAEITFTPKKRTLTSVFRYSVLVKGKTDGQKVLSADKFVGDGE